MFRVFAALTASRPSRGRRDVGVRRVVGDRLEDRLPLEAAGLNNDIFVVSSAGGAATRLTRHRGDSNP